jgi:hypothetical protein
MKPTWVRVAEQIGIVVLVGVLAFLALQLAGCPAPRPPVVVGTCADVCARGRELRCGWAEATREGAACEDVCENVQASGVLAWDLACRAQVQTCGAVDACEMK